MARDGQTGRGKSREEEMQRGAGSWLSVPIPRGCLIREERRDALKEKKGKKPGTTT